MFTKAEENYLKTIYTLVTEENGGTVNTNSIAERMNTKASSVTDMIRKLSEKELLIYKKYQGVILSEKGEKIAVYIIRKHRLWETFLVNKLNFGWDEVHEVAEQLEHIKSEELIDRLDEFLSFPSADPHGEPIPSKSGNILSVSRTLLSDLQSSEKGVVVGVKNSSDALLQHLDRLKIIIGTELTFLSKVDFDNSISVEDNSGRQINLSVLISTNVYVKKI